MNKKSWLDKLFYQIGKQQYDFYLSGLYKTDNNVKATKWKKFSEVVFSVDFGEDWKLNWVNQRQILPNEIVLDIERKTQLQDTINKLKKLHLSFYIFSAGKGFHVHIFFSEAISTRDKLLVTEYFGADSMKSNEKSLIALEFSPHWKSGKIKEIIHNGNSS